LEDKRLILNPMKITDEKGFTRIRFFVLLPETNEIFEWNLVKPYILKKDEYTDDPIMKTLRAFTTWNFSYPTLDDPNLWNEKVLAKEGGKYKYLTKLN
jgi:hypothetical protein